MITRADHAAIARWIAPGSRVLDLGCGDGSLLAHLRAERGAFGYGVEIAPENILACLKRGVNVIQMDLESGLSAFEDQSFDCVILSQTLQAMHHTELVLRELIRVGREAVVSFPNFGYWRHRLQILGGHMPVSRSLPYQWYDTPNVHLGTLIDLETLVARVGARIVERLVLHDGKPVTRLPNLLGSLALYRLESNGGAAQVAAPSSS